VILVNNALAWGGVERQVVYVLKGLVRDLHRPVALLCLRLHAGKDYRFYAPALLDEPLEVTDIRDDAWSDSYLAQHVPAAQRDIVARAVCSLPEDVQVLVRRFLAEFLDRRPAVVHAWQDEVSIAAGYAAVIVGVPRVILSSRNMRPTNFDYYRPYMADGYRSLAKVNTVVLVNNSEAGAADYASWIGIAPERFVVKRNGIDPAVFQRASAPEVASFRIALGIPNAAPVVGSVFRLYDEKRPLLWVEMAAQVGRQYPNAHFVIFGTGPLRDQVRAMAEQYNIGGRFHLPGTTQKPHLAISAMDVFVLTSCFEGTPNVILEAQLLGVPVVATDAGGTREALDQGQTGWLVEDATPTALADRVLTVLADPEWRARARDGAPRFVAERFGLERMIQETRALYELEERPQPEPGQASDRPQP
jgi:glycosyltransferase involved in cell wall biosynthesis